MKYTGAYCANDTIYVLNEMNIVQSEFKITSGFTAIGQPNWIADKDKGRIAILVKSKNGESTYVMTYTPNGSQLSSHRA